MALQQRQQEQGQESSFLLSDVYWILMTACVSICVLTVSCILAKIPKKAGQKSFKCEHCEQSFRTRAQLRRHIRDDHPFAAAAADQQQPSTSSGSSKQTCPKVGNFKQKPFH